MGDPLGVCIDTFNLCDRDFFIFTNELFFLLTDEQINTG